MVVLEALRSEVASASERATYELLEESSRLARMGVDVISFGIGQPDFTARDFIVEELEKAVESGLQKYTSPRGIEEFRKAVVEYVWREYGVEVCEREVMPVPGACAGIFITLYSILNECDKVVVMDPSFPQYFDAVKLNRGVLKPVKLLESESGYRVDVDGVREALKDGSVKAIIINSPQNPTGMLIDRRDFMELLDTAREENVVVISDEIYDHYVYDGDYTSCLHHDDWRSFCIHVNSLSKTFGMTGWRIGFIIASENVINKLVAVANTIYGCMQPFIMKAAAKALSSSMEWFKEVYREYKARRDLIYRLLREVEGVKCPEPKGAFYVYPNISCVLDKTGLDLQEFCKKLLVEAGVLVVPGSVFSVLGDNAHVRMSYAIPADRIREGVERIKSFIEKLGSR